MRRGRRRGQLVKACLFTLVSVKLYTHGLQLQNSKKNAFTLFHFIVA